MGFGVLFARCAGRRDGALLQLPLRPHARVRRGPRCVLFWVLISTRKMKMKNNINLTTQRKIERIENQKYIGRRYMVKFIKFQFRFENKYSSRAKLWLIHFYRVVLRYTKGHCFFITLRNLHRFDPLPRIVVICPPSLLSML